MFSSELMITITSNANAAVRQTRILFYSLSRQVANVKGSSSLLAGLLIVWFVSIRLVSSIEQHIHITTLYSEGKQGCFRILRWEGELEWCLELLLAGRIVQLLVSVHDYEVYLPIRNSLFNLCSLFPLNLPQILYHQFQLKNINNFI